MIDKVKKLIKTIISEVLNFSLYIKSIYYISKNLKRVRYKAANGEVLNIVFVVQYIPGWNKLEPIYSKMKEDDRFNPIIVCVPLNIQNNHLLADNGNETYEYFIEHGYEAIDSMSQDSSWYDLRQLNPDYIFHSRPYNHYMPKCYTSGKIVKYALICNVLYSASVTTDLQTCTLNRNYYKDVYCYFAVDKSECDFFRKRFFTGFIFGVAKCYPYGAIGLEQMIEARVENT